MSDWQGIESAPKDGTPVLLAPHMITAAWDFGDEEWLVFSVPLNKDGTIADDWTKECKMAFCVYANVAGVEPTHWMPLPPPPGAKDESAT